LFLTSYRSRKNSSSEILVSDNSDENDELGVRETHNPGLNDKVKPPGGDCERSAEESPFVFPFVLFGRASCPAELLEYGRWEPSAELVFDSSNPSIRTNFWSSFLGIRFPVMLDDGSKSRAGIGTLIRESHEVVLVPRYAASCTVSAGAPYEMSCSLSDRLMLYSQRTNAKNNMLQRLL